MSLVTSTGRSRTTHRCGKAWVLLGASTSISASPILVEERFTLEMSYEGKRGKRQNFYAAKINERLESYKWLPVS
jgi:hypothetical protein